MPKTVQVNINVPTWFDELVGHYGQTGGKVREALKPIDNAATEFALGVFLSKVQEFKTQMGALVSSEAVNNVTDESLAIALESGVDVAICLMVLFGQLNIPFDSLIEAKINANKQKRYDTPYGEGMYQLAKPEGYVPANIPAILKEYYNWCVKVENAMAGDPAQEQEQPPVEPAANDAVEPRVDDGGYK